MPKIKTKKSAAKRFKKSNPRGGKDEKIMYNKANRNHLRTKKSNRRKNREQPTSKVGEHDEEVIKKLIQ